VNIPRVLFVRITEDFVTHILDRCAEYNTAHSDCVRDSYSKREALWALLGPKLAHPHHTAELARICTEEEGRRERYSELITSHRDSILLYLTEQSSFIIQQVSGCTKTLFDCAESAIQPENIRKITSDGEKVLQIKNRLRDSMMNRNEESKDKGSIVIDTNAGFTGTSGDESGLITARNTLLHQAVIECRDSTMSSVENVCKVQRELVSAVYQEWLVSEGRWCKRWSKAVSDINMLVDGAGCYVRAEG